MPEQLPLLTRSQIMARVKSKDTAPEMAVRRAFHAAGLRYALHKRGMPGTPDMVLARHRTVVFVNGCFWHGHSCGRGRIPNTNVDFWRAKIERNRARDAWALRELEAAGWFVRTVWECETKDPDHLDILACAIAYGTEEMEHEHGRITAESVHDSRARARDRAGAHQVS